MSNYIPSDRIAESFNIQKLRLLQWQKDLKRFNFKIGNLKSSSIDFKFTVNDTDYLYMVGDFFDTPTDMLSVLNELVQKLHYNQSVFINYPYEIDSWVRLNLEAKGEILLYFGDTNNDFHIYAFDCLDDDLFDLLLLNNGIDYSEGVTLEQRFIFGISVPKRIFIGQVIETYEELRNRFSDELYSNEWSYYKIFPTNELNLLKTWYNSNSK